MSIWHNKNLNIEQINALSPNTIAEVLGIEFTAVGEEYLQARMPVDHRTHQPYGLLHGGASAVLAETLGSVGAYCTVDPTRFRTVGIEINCNHVRGVKSGWVIGTARPLHIGGKTQVWEIRIENEAQKLVCISRLTMAVIVAG